jgi:sugar phosphate isomerase/epimerase
LDYAKAVKKAGDACGIPCVQAHSPFGTISSPEDFDFYVTLHRRAIEMCHELECDMLVVHPGNHYGAVDNYTNLYAKLLPLAERLGVRLATENMWNWNEEKTITHPSACGTVEDFCAHIDIANSYYLTGCLDLGHAEMTDAPGAATMIRGLGKSRIGCLHVHDNDHLRDKHTLPYQGKIDWESVIEALREIGYEGHFIYEAGNFIKYYPDELVMLGLTHMEQVGRYLIKRITE